MTAIGLWGLLMLPPLRLSVAGRGGALLPLELAAPFVALVLLWRQGFHVRACPSLKAFLLYLAACLPSTFQATDLGRHLYGFLIFGFAAIFLCIASTARPGRAFLHDLIRFSPVPFLILALIVLGTAWADGLLVYSGQRKMVTDYGGSNFLASMLLLGAYVPLGVAIGGRGRGGRMAALATFALIVAAIVATGSRSAMALLPVGCVVTVIVLRRGQRAAWARIAAASLALALVLIVLAPYLSGMVRYGRFRDPFEQHNWLVRLAVFELYWNEFQASPWVGHGLFNIRLSPVLTVVVEGVQESWGAHFGAHNWLLQNLADAGVLGGAGFIVFLAAAGRTLVAGVRRGHRSFPYSTGWLAGFVMVVLHGLIEPNFSGKPLIYLFVLQLGLAEQVRRVDGAGRPARLPASVPSRSGPAPAEHRISDPGTALA